MTRFLLIIIFLMPVQVVFSQVYIEKQSRHRFAQMTLGFDVQSSIGGSSKFADLNGDIQSIILPSTYTPRFLIGGTHFWGHADFHIAIPVYFQTVKKRNQEIKSYKGVETVFKYYPYRIESNKIRPYIGLSIAPFYHEQNNENLNYPSGPELNHTSFPLLAGMTYNSRGHLLEFGFSWNYQNQQNYYISSDQVEKINTAPLFATLSYKLMFDTTLGAEKNWISGKTQEITTKLAELKILNGVYLGIGLSSAFWVRESSYNTENRPYIGKYDTSLMADFTLGYYIHKPDINLAFGYRSYGTSTDTYGAIQVLKRKSTLFEVTKTLFDYHGFVPFVGPAVSYENLDFIESFEDVITSDIGENKFAYGFTFGWDIRPNRIQSWILRTNLRWYPNLHLEIEPNSKIFFDNLEFNFIQLIIYPNRIIF